MALRLASEYLPLMKWKLLLDNSMMSINGFHTTPQCKKQRNPFSMAEAGRKKLLGVEKKVEKKETPSQLTGTNDVIHRKTLPRVFHTWETGAAYLKSQAYYSTYGDEPVWTMYRRNHMGQYIFAPKPRDSCFTKENRFLLNNPCPLCRDEYLVVHFRNTELLKQFLDRLTGDILDIKKTGLCLYQHNEVRAHLLQSREHGYMEFAVPFRNYDYRHYYPSLKNESDEEAMKAQHVVAVSDQPERLSETRPYPFVKFPEHFPCDVSRYDI